jgi:hypothetical protein
MEKHSGKTNQAGDSLGHSDISFSNEISTTTLVKLLIRKGILTPKEVLEEERVTRFNKQIVENKIQNHLLQKKKKRSRLKRWASKHRWSRRLTSRLFGWEWKRNKHSHHSAPLE